MNKPTHSELLTALMPTVKQMDFFRMQTMLRQARTRLEILIVDDPLSGKIVMNLLKSEHKTTLVTDARQGMKSYLSVAPDISFFKIELPDLDGNRLAEIVKLVDPTAHFVMVSDKERSEDMAYARKNGSKGFIVKPYDQEKVLDVIGKFRQEKK